MRFVVKYSRIKSDFTTIDEHILQGLSINAKCATSPFRPNLNFGTILYVHIKSTGHPQRPLYANFVERNTKIRKVLSLTRALTTTWIGRRLTVKFVAKVMLLSSLYRFIWIATLERKCFLVTFAAWNLHRRIPLWDIRKSSTRLPQLRGEASSRLIGGVGFCSNFQTLTRTFFFHFGIQGKITNVGLCYCW